jgi:hypothetical protein
MIAEEAVDGRLQIDTNWKTPRSRRRLVRVAKKTSTGLSQEAEVTVVF